MCGISGYLSHKNDRVKKSLLINMQRRLSHRGPDDTGLWISKCGHVGLAHNRLSIIDLSQAGRQPMGNRDQSVVVCFNGEIYNYKALRNCLLELGHHFATQTDTEVIIHAYEEWGIECLKKFDGMFAFALFDRENDTLFLVRDRFGIKPLYFSEQDGYLSFASEIKALWELPWNEKDISESAFSHYLTFMVTPAPYTIYKNVYKLPAGFYAQIRNNNISFHEWYSPITALPLGEKKNFHDEHFCIEKIRTLLQESTKKRMISDVPFGAFLSGGIDSSLNVALMANEIKKVKTFSIAFDDGPETNELKWARLVADIFDTDHHEITISQRDAENFYKKMIYHLDEPLADCVCIPFYHVAKLAKDAGVTVVQVGEGSDELFFGYDIYARYYSLYKKFWRPTKIVPQFLKKFLYHGTKKILPQKITGPLDKWAKNQHLFWGGAIAFCEQQKRTLINKNFSHDPMVEKIFPGLQTENHSSHDIVAYHLRQLKKRDPQASFMKQMLYLELKQRLPELLLMRADKMSMATSIEARVPFLDHRLVEFAFHIPDGLKYKNKTTKYILKEACRGILPNEIIDRKKVGFAAPITRWYNQVDYTSALHKWVLKNFRSYAGE